MEAIRQFVNDILMLTGSSKAFVARQAGVQSSALSHWLSGKPSISPDKLSRVLETIGLKIRDGHVLFADNEELISPRTWRADDAVTDSVIRVMGRIKDQYGDLNFGLPVDMRGVAVFFTSDGLFGAVQKCNPLLLIGHKNTAAPVGVGVVQRILDGDTKALIDACKALALTGRVDLDALDVSHHIRETTFEDQQNHHSSASMFDFATQITDWADVSATAIRYGLSHSVVKLLIRRYSELPVADQEIILKGAYPTRRDAASFSTSKG